MTSYIEYVDSDFRVTGVSHDFTYELSLPREYNRCAVLSANIPKSYYLIQSNNNTFIVVENSTPRTITVPIGNYSNVEFMTLTIALLNAGPLTYTYSIDKPTTLITLTATGGVWNSINFPSTSALYRQLGYLEASSNIINGNTTTSTSIPLFQQTNICFIRSDVHDSQSSSLGAGILQSISCINQPTMYSITYQHAGDLQIIAKPTSFKRLVKFTITDSDGFLLQLGNLPVNIEIIFFDYDDSATVLKNKALIDNLESMVNESIRK